MNYFFLEEKHVKNKYLWQVMLTPNSIVVMAAESAECISPVVTPAMLNVMPEINVVQFIETLHSFPTIIPD